ncbi:MAG: Lrp/AsnC family transcriptional regulator [Microbacteriaceae bacterium]
MTKKSPMSALVGAVDRPADRVPLDDVDLALLQELSRDSRQSQRALARAVGMSAPAVADRIARLERFGVIRSYSVDIDWDRLGYDVSVYMPIILEAGNDLEPTLEAFRAIPELEELVVVAGQYDLIARFRLSDHRRLRELLLDRVWQIPNVRRFETVLALGSLGGQDFATRMLAVHGEQG